VSHRRPFAIPGSFGDLKESPLYKRTRSAFMDKTIATFTIHRPAAMTPKGRHEIAQWLRDQAAFLETDGPKMANRFTARYFAR